MADHPHPTRIAGLTPGEWIKKAVVFIVTMLFLGWFYGWASPHGYPKERTLGFGYGALHGALMPMALPSLVMGKNVDIFAPNNSGRPYKIGYIVGINLCGLLVFGSAFWKPKRKLEELPKYPSTQVPK
jgi:hypothetical protein